MNELDIWDPFAPTFPRLAPVTWKREKICMLDARWENGYERKLRMLTQLSKTCLACSMCDLGMRDAHREDAAATRDPHVFSNMNPTRFMIVGQNPGWEELKQGTPFVGPAGANFDRELKRWGLSRADFYICNTNRCYTHKNKAPTPHQRDKCEPFLRMEINQIRPLLVVALGAVAFDAVCDSVSFQEGRGVVSWSNRYRVPVFGAYHPSPRNLDDELIAREFSHQMKLMCGLVRKLKERTTASDYPPREGTWVSLNTS